MMMITITARMPNTQVRFFFHHGRTLSVRLVVATP
jgi:hypothetical protein